VNATETTTGTETSSDGDALSRDQMERLLRDDAVRVERASTALTHAQTTYHRATQRGLYLTEAAHTASFKEHLAPLEDAERAAADAAGVAERNAFTVRRQIGDDRTTLDPAGLAAAAQRLPLVEHDVTRLPLPRLATEVRAAIAGGDRVAMYLYAKLAPARIAKQEDPRGDDPTTAAARGELGQRIAQIHAALRDTAFDGVRTRTDATLEHAGQLRAAAAKRRRDAAPLLTSDGRAKVRWPEAG